MSAERLAYVVSRFPTTTETFVVREMDAMARRGFDIDVYPLVDARPAVANAASIGWLPRMRPLPWVSPGVLAAVLRHVRRHPVTVARGLARMTWGHRASPAFLARALLLAPKAVAWGEDMRRRGVRHVHAHFATHSALAAMIAARVAGVPFSFQVHAHDLYVDRTFLREKIRAASFVTTISEYNRRWLVHLGPEAAARIHVVRCGPALRPASPVRGGAGVAVPSGPHVVSVAQLKPYKGIRHLVAAAGALRPRLPGLQVTIVGDGPERPALEARRAALGLGDVVRMTGALPAEAVTDVLARADVFAAPSVVQPSGKMDGIPVALMEAMAAGVPVVASDLSGIPELVRDGDTGLLVPPGDERALAAAVERLWTEPGLGRRLAAAARAAVLADYDVDENAGRLARLVRERPRTP